MNTLSHWKKSVPISIKRRKHPLRQAHTVLDKIMDEFYDRFDMSEFFSKKDFNELSLAPSIDVVDGKESIKIEAEMPGIGVGDLHVSATDNAITIKAEKKVSKKDEGENYLVREIGYGAYERTIPLPESVDIERARASFKKGMLWIDIPKTEECAKKCRDIKVENISDTH